MTSSSNQLNSSAILTTRRGPVVVVMGHVDHGKTTLLDTIRKSNVAAREAGGITQGVGAYEIVHNNERITFIDTPGHEAFSKMRARGAKIADIAILLVAADDSVKPQTKEAIKTIFEAKLPFIVAINKIDKTNGDIDKVKNDLLQNEVLLEGFGGSTSFQPISAKTGAGVNELLDIILLTAEVENLTYDPSAPASGYVLEAHVDKRIGNLVTMIVKNGTLKTGQAIIAGSASGKVKDLKNFAGEKVSELTPSAPAIVLGFETLPAIGETFTVGTVKEIAVAKKKPLPPAGEKQINFILKANVAGSLEALNDAIIKLKPPQDMNLVIIDQSVGEVTDGDAKLAASTNSSIVAFKTKINSAAQNVIKASHIKVFESEIIYELLELIEKELEAAQKKIISGELEILAVFDQKNIAKQIVGGKVVAGVMKNQADLEIQRRGAIIGTGKIVNLQQNKKEAAEVAAELECGLLVNTAVTIAVGDRLISRAIY